MSALDSIPSTSLVDSNDILNFCTFLGIVPEYSSILLFFNNDYLWKKISILSIGFMLSSHF